MGISSFFVHYIQSSIQFLWYEAVPFPSCVLPVHMPYNIARAVQTDEAVCNNGAQEEEEDADTASNKFAKKKQGMKSFRALGAFKDAEDPSAAFDAATSKSSTKEIARDKVTLKQELGAGAFGVVMLGEYTQEDGTMVKCACKTLKSTNPDDFDALQAEASTSQRIGPPARPPPARSSFLS